MGEVGPETAEAVRIDPDWELLRRVAAGDVESFGPLVERHQERLLRLCERLLGDAEEARDAAQEAFLKAFRNAGGFRPRGQVYTWLYRIAVNHCFNRLRRRKLVRFLSLSGSGNSEEESGTYDFDPPATGPSAATELEARRRWQATRRAIDALPPGQRAVLVLAKFEGLSYRDIARRLGMPDGTVATILHRTRRVLQGNQERLLGVHR